MKRLNKDKGLVFSFVCIFAVFFIGAYVIANTYHTSPAGFDSLNSAQTSLDQVGDIITEPDKLSWETHGVIQFSRDRAKLVSGLLHMLEESRS